MYYRFLSVGLYYWNHHIITLVYTKLNVLYVASPCMHPLYSYFHVPKIMLPILLDQF